MKRPWVHMSSPSRSLLPPPSPLAPSRSSQSTRSERYAEQKKRHRFIEQSFRLCGRRYALFTYCWILLRIFQSIFMRDISPEVYENAFVCYQRKTGLIKYTGNYALLLDFLEDYLWNQCNFFLVQPQNSPVSTPASGIFC